MTDRPIIFSGPMVRALLDERKTQTRRLATSPLRRCEIGDRLYVREAFTATFWTPDDIDAPPRELWATPDAERTAQFCSERYYRLDEEGKRLGFIPEVQWTPSIHMPRWASRLTLTLTEVRLQRLQDITDVDAIREGIIGVQTDGLSHYGTNPTDAVWPKPARAFRNLWDGLHTKPGETWAYNPEIVALTFTVAHGNIDGQS